MDNVDPVDGQVEWWDDFHACFTSERILKSNHLEDYIDRMNIN